MRLSLLSLILLAAPAWGQDARVAWAWANTATVKDSSTVDCNAAWTWAVALAEPDEQPHPDCDCVNCQCDPCLCNDYGAAYRKAVKEQKRLVVFVGEPKRELVGAVTIHKAEFHGLKSGVVVGIPDGQGGLNRMDLPAKATDAHIRETRLALPVAQTVAYAPVFTPAMFGMNCVGGVCR